MKKVVFLDFWNRLRDELNYQNITHRELASKINIQKATLEAKFVRENIPDAEFVFQCSKILNLSMDYLYSGENSAGLNDDEMDIVRLYKNLKPEFKAAVKTLLHGLSES